MDRQRSRRGAGAWAALWLMACVWEPEPDPLAARCVRALRVDAPRERVEVLGSDLDVARRTVEVRYGVRRGHFSQAREGRVACRFEPGDRWVFEHVAVEGEPLSRAALALVNAKLLVDDLSRPSDRFDRRS